MFTPMRYLLWLMLLSLLFCPIKVQKYSKTVHFLAAGSTCSEHYVRNFKVNIWDDNKTLDIMFNVARNYTFDPWILVKVDWRMSPKGNQLQSMFEYDFNGCNFLGKVGTSSKGFLTSWLKSFWAGSGLPKSCPLLEGNYSWLGLNMEHLNLPSFLPNSKYDVMVLTYFRKKSLKDVICNVKLVVEVK